MKWRTDTPTADVIVVKLKESFCHHPFSYRVLYKGHFGLYYYGDGCEDIPPSVIEKWADLGEEEVVTDCHQLGEEIQKELEKLGAGHGGWNDGLRDEDLRDFARHFAEWGAEHTFTHHETDESLQEAVTHQMEDEQVIDDYVRKGLDEVCLRYAELGAKWGAEHLKKIEK